MGLVNNSLVRPFLVRLEYIQASCAALALVGFSLVFGPRPRISSGTGDKPEVRMAFLPNLTHAPALIGLANHTFESGLSNYTFSSKAVNAGPEAMEALLAGAIDVAYVGPSPALNTYVKTNGKALRILAGVCEGGAALICRKGLDLHSVADLNGLRVAVPEFGGTQDVSLRHFLKAAHLEAREAGGSVEILPIKNPEILSLFKQAQVDAAWVPEPWATRLVQEAGGKLVVEESSLWPSHRFSTTVMVASTKFIAVHPDAVTKLVEENRQIIQWIGKHPEEAARLANEEIGRQTGKEIRAKTVKEAWKNLTFSATQDRASLAAFREAAGDAEYVSSSFRLDDKIWFPEVNGIRPDTLASATR